MKYKLNEITINLHSGDVLCKCQFVLQSVTYQVSFTLSEADLYESASENGRESWDNPDVVLVAKNKLMIEVEL